MADDTILFDWVNLPPGAIVQSLWSCLHDASLREIHSDLLGWRVTVEIDSHHLRVFRGLADDVRFLIEMAGVRSVRAETFTFWPGGFTRPPGISRAEESRLIKDYWGRGRNESVSWRDFEAAVLVSRLELKDAGVAFGDETVALQLGGHLGGDRYYTAFFRADRLVIGRSDGQDFGLDQLVSWGEAYWDAFARREP